MLKKVCATTGLVIAATAGALALGSPAYASGPHDNAHNANKNSNGNKIYVINKNDNSAQAHARAGAVSRILDLLL